MWSTRVYSQRKATWLAFAVVVLGVCSSLVLAGDTKPPKALDVSNPDNVLLFSHNNLNLC